MNEDSTESRKTERRAARTRPSTRLIGNEIDDSAGDSNDRHSGELRAPDVLVGESLTQPPQQDRSRRAREALIVAALARFTENGYEATTVDDISKQAGVAVGGFYLHFRSKRQVLLVLVDRLLNELDTFTEVTSADTEAIFACLRDRFRASWDYAGVYRAWREATLRDAELAALHEQVDAWAIARTASALTAAAAAPGARATVSVTTLAYMFTTIFWRQLEVQAADRGLLSDALSAVIQHALFEDRAPASTEDESGANRGESR
ncbi:MAG TPA: helix-turn-helix domain-containing protein [Candidatus Elarobacter sp.]|nr:helix-turn-helix domain-containing protein [Candidatus Elarobacter sp.]